MRMKVNCDMLAAAEGDLRDLANRLQSIADEITAAQRALLSSGDTFRREVRALDARRRAVEREITQTHAMSDALGRLIELYVDCERRQQNDLFGNAAGFGELWRDRIAVPMTYISAEQFSKSYGDLIR